MSIKDIFYKKEAILEDQSKLTSSVESVDLIEQVRIKNKKFIPDVDFSDPANFARFGSAKEYYDGSIKRIYEQYPYDGSEAEKLEFYNNSTYLDQWLFDNKYPKSTGYAIFSAESNSISSTVGDYGIPSSKEYIYTAGSIHTASVYQHTASQGIGTLSLANAFDKGVIYDESKNRTQSFKVKPTEGVSIQFWLKKDAFGTATTDREVILDLWNGNTVPAGVNSTPIVHNYGRLTLELSGGLSDPTPYGAVYLTLQSSSVGIINEKISSDTYNAAAIANSSWQHHTVTVKSIGVDLIVNYYIDGLLNKKTTFSTTTAVGELSGKIDSFIGALQTKPSGSTYASSAIMTGAGKLSASMDDFRYWKKELSAEYVKNTWFYPIGGGSNTDDYRVDLGTYYKFNEGITGVLYYDSTVLDYSGRISNGTWTGYSINSRNTGSAFVSSSVLTSEPGDPIIRVDHSLVKDIKAEMSLSGSKYDKTNTSYMYDSVPVWLRDEDTNNNIKYLFQILSSYFDTLYCQIKEIPRLKEKNYFSGSSVPNELVSRLLNDKGMIVPGSFLSHDVLNQFWQRDTHNNYFEQDLEKTKRLIYYNIYNNLEFILKSKGTEKSFRNLLRCFGIDDELVKLNIYADNAKLYIKDRYKNSSLKTKFVDFNSPDRFGSTITQTTSSNNTISYIYGSDSSLLETNNAFTFEGDIIFPSKFKLVDNTYFTTDFLTCSLFGFNEAGTSDPADYTFGGSNDANLQVYACRDFEESSNVKFQLKNKAGTINLETNFFKEVYENERWSFSVCISPVGYPYAGSFATAEEPSYSVDFYGVTYNNEEIKSEFSTGSIVSNAVGKSLLTKPKRVYLGANRENFTGSVVYSTDVKFGSFRVWFDKLSQEAIKQHNIDPSNYGHNKIYGHPTAFIKNISGSTQIPAMDSLVLHWNFDQNSLSDTSGKFIVDDFSSGSTSNLYRWASNIIERENKGLGLNFPVSTKVFNNEFIFARLKELPEISFSDDRIIIMDDEKEFLIEDEDTTDNVFSLEKSMNQSISEQMVKTFSTMKEYANLFAKPVDHYRYEYKRLRKARSLFFERTTGNPDFEKFTEYFKWIDSSLSFFIEQLKPASVTFTDGVSDVVESHIFERPKYIRKFPRIKEIPSTEGTVRGISELDYNWKFGHSPEYKASSDNIHALWKKTREERSDLASRESIRKIIEQKSTSNVLRLGQPVAGGAPQAYISEGHIQAVRRFSRLYKLSVGEQPIIHGGTNYNKNKNRDFIYDAIKPHGATTNLGVPVNAVVVGLGPGQGIISSTVIDDVEDPNEKEKFQFRMTVGKDSSGDGTQPSTASLGMVYEVKSAYGSPFNIISGNVDDGANRQVDSNYKDNVILTNLHSDTTYFSNDIPMQGPFTETWVGGRQHRHVNINRYNENLSTTNNLDDEYTRPESFRILFGEHPDEAVQDGAMGIVGPDYGGPYPDTTRKQAIYYRGFRAKRPYNVQNIQGSAYKQGNYERKYEYFNVVGRLENNSRFKKAASEASYEISGTFLPASIKSVLPETTHPMTLIAQIESSNGNVFGTHLNNRQPDGQLTEPATTSSISFRLNQANNIDDDILLQITGASVDVLVETVAGSVAKSSPDITVTTGPRGLALMADTTVTAIASDTSYGGIGTDDFSYSFWHNDVSGSAAGANTKIGFARTSISNMHYVYFNSTSEIKVVLEDNSNNTDTETFSTPIEANLWNHYAVSIPNSNLASGVPKLWKNGVELSGDGGYTGLAGGSPNIADAYIYLDEFAAIQDLIVWDKLLSDEDVTVIYNKGKIFDPQNHNSSSNVIDWYKFGNEPYWASLGYNSGSQLDDIGGAITRYISSSFGTGNNSLKITNSTDHEWQFIKGLVSGSFTDTQVWNSLSSSLSSSFPLWQVSYTNETTYAAFQLEKYIAGTNTVGLTKSGSGTTGISNLSVAAGENNKFAKDIVIERESDFLTGSTRNKTVITSRFSAPGGIEVQTYGYLDAYAREYSVHNNLNYRNLSIRGPGSGESGTIRTNSHANTRDGLRALYQRYMGRGGVDSVHEVVDETDYNLTASFHKIPRNTLVTPRSGSSTIEIVERRNNLNYQSMIPASDYNYSWVTSSLGDNYSVRSGTQKAFGYWPKDGLNKVNGIIDTAITFPTASEY
jgi:hypothetical protein